MTDSLIIFDTTLRDGEQSPGASMTPEEKMQIAKALEASRPPSSDSSGPPRVVPNAKYYVHLGEFEHARHPTERDRASNFDDNYVPLKASGALSLLEGDAVIATGVEVIRVPGHTANMQCVRLTGGGKAAFLFADLVPTTAHLPLPWIMGYDLYPMTTLEQKKKWIPEVVHEGWLALFGHDPEIRAAYLRERDGKFEAEPARID